MLMIAQWKNYWYSYRHTNPISKVMNIWVLVTLLLILIVGLTGYSIKTGNYVKSLETNMTNLQMNYDNCIKTRDQFSSDLETCNTNLQTKVSTLSSCRTEIDILGDNLSECKNDLNTCQADYDDAINKYNECKDDLSSVKSEKNNLQSNFDQLKSNYINDYVRDWCCLNFKAENTSKTYYTFSGNDITCHNTNVSGAAEFNCP